MIRMMRTNFGTQKKVVHSIAYSSLHLVIAYSFIFAPDSIQKGSMTEEVKKFSESTLAVTEL